MYLKTAPSWVGAGCTVGGVTAVLPEVAADAICLVKMFRVWPPRDTRTLDLDLRWSMSSRSILSSNEILATSGISFQSDA